MAWSRSPNSKGRTPTEEIMARITGPHSPIKQSIVTPTPVTAVKVLTAGVGSLVKAHHHFLGTVWSGLDGLGYTQGTD